MGFLESILRIKIENAAEVRSREQSNSTADNNFGNELANVAVGRWSGRKLPERKFWRMLPPFCTLVRFIHHFYEKEMEGACLYYNFRLLFLKL